MAANIHPTTGIAYGVVDARNLPYLLDDIISNGTDNAYQEVHDEIVEALKACQTAEEFNHYVANCPYGLYGTAWPLEDDGDLSGVDFEEVASQLLQEWEYDGWDYDYETDGYKFHLGGLGGAPLLWVMESPFIAWCRGCSPCVPNAGDLDNIVAGGDGMIAYCFDPDDFMPDSDDRPKFVVRRHEPGGLAHVSIED